MVRRAGTNRIIRPGAIPILRLHPPAPWQIWAANDGGLVLEPNCSWCIQFCGSLVSAWKQLHRSMRPGTDTRLLALDVIVCFNARRLILHTDPEFKTRWTHLSAKMFSIQGLNVRYNLLERHGHAFRSCSSIKTAALSNPHFALSIVR